MDIHDFLEFGQFAAMIFAIWRLGAAIGRKDQILMGMQTQLTDLVDITRNLTHVDFTQGQEIARIQGRLDGLLTNKPSVFSKSEMVV